MLFRSPWAALESAVRGAAGPHLEAIQFFEEYRGRQVPAGRKSLHFGLTFRAADRTLTGEEVDQAMQAVIAACKLQFRAELRGT